MLVKLFEGRFAVATSISMFTSLPKRRCFKKSQILINSFKATLQIIKVDRFNTLFMALFGGQIKLLHCHIQSVMNGESSTESIDRFIDLDIIYYTQATQVVGQL